MALTLDTTGRDGIYMTVDGERIMLVAPGPGGAPGAMTAAGQAAYSQGWGLAISALRERWRKLYDTGELARRRANAIRNEIESIAELFQIASEHGDPAALAQAMRQSDALTRGTPYETPGPVRDAAQAALATASRLRTRAIDTIDAASSSVATWHSTLRFVSVAGIAITLLLAIRSIAKAVRE